VQKQEWERTKSQGQERQHVDGKQAVVSSMTVDSRVCVREQWGARPEALGESRSKGLKYQSKKGTSQI
jgi:hypothetical protein